MNKTNEFEFLSEELKEQIRDWLKYFEEVDVTYYCGEYHIGALVVYDKAPEDYEFIGTYNQRDVFTVDERILNFMEAHHEYHILYKGYQDYAWLKSLKRGDKFRFDENGNIVKA